MGTINNPSNQTNDKGAILGNLVDNGGSFTSFQSCFWIDGCGVSKGYGWNSGTVSGIAKVTREKLQAEDMIAQLGEDYTFDSNKVNKGYPILKWQEGR